MACQPPGVHPPMYPRGSGHAKVVPLPEAGDPHAQWAKWGRMIDGKVVVEAIRVNEGGVRQQRVSHIAARVSDAEVSERKWRFVCDCGFYAHNEAPKVKHEAKTGHRVGGE